MVGETLPTINMPAKHKKRKIAKKVKERKRKRWREGGFDGKKMDTRCD